MALTWRGVEKDEVSIQWRYMFGCGQGHLRLMFCLGLTHLTQNMHSMQKLFI